MKRSLLSLVLCACALAASAKPVAHVGFASGETIVLRDTRGGCAPDRLEVLGLHPNGTVKFRGCWAPRGANVHIEWDDEDETELPMRVFKLVDAV